MYFGKSLGGGYFKIVNQSVPLALRNLGYSEEEINEIVNYAKGHATLESAPNINHDSLRSKGFSSEDLEKVESGLASAFEISFAFNQWCTFNSHRSTNIIVSGSYLYLAKS